MKKLDYTLQFNTPAFMGGSDPQKAQWRTPPIKTMLRFWWRIYCAESCNYDTDSLREKEAALFGSASGDSGEASKIKIRLLPEGKEASAWSMPVKQPLTPPKGMDPILYAGYGPVQTRQVFEALMPGEPVRLTLLVPDENEKEISAAMALAHRFAALGGRHAKGWGSLDIAGTDSGVKSPILELEDALTRDWPAALGTANGKPLRWQLNQTFESWEKALKTFGQIKKELINGTAGKNQRALVSYPVTKNSQWGNNYRLPSQMMFKVHRQDSGKLIGEVFQLPHKPHGKHVNITDLLNVWSAIHKQLDTSSQLTRVEK